MKRTFALLLALSLLFIAGCTGKTEPPAATPAPTEAPATPVPEPPAPLPKLETGTVQGNQIPAILQLLNRGDVVEVTGNPDEAHATVKLENGSGTVEMQLLRFADEEAFEVWEGYAQYNAALYSSYQLAGQPLKTLSLNTKLEVLDELDSCYLVSLEGETGFIAKEQLSKYPIQTYYYGGGDSGSSGGGGGGGYSGGQDGGDINIDLVVRTGQAQVRADGTPVVLKYFNAGDTVQIVAEDGFAPALEGYVTILVDDVYAYLPQQWVQRESDEAFTPWEGYASSKCQLFDNHLLSGDAVKKLSTNTALTVLWEAGDVCFVRAGDELGFVSADAILTTPIVEYYYGGGDSGSSGGGSGGGGSDWTPPAL